MSQPTSGHLSLHADWLALGLKFAAHLTRSATAPQFHVYNNGSWVTVNPSPGTAVPSASNVAFSTPYDDLRLNQPRAGATQFAQGMHLNSSTTLDALADNMTWVFDCTAIHTATTSNAAYFVLFGGGTPGTLAIILEWINATSQRLSFFVRGASFGTYRRAGVLIEDGAHHRFAVRYTRGNPVEIWRDGTKLGSGDLVNVDDTFGGATPTPTTALNVIRQVDSCIPANGSHILGFNTALSDAEIESLLSDPWRVTLGLEADVDPPEMSGEITISDLTPTSYTASWSAATDNVGVTGYEYRINEGSWVDVGNVLTTPISGRTPGASDDLDVRAYDAAGNRAEPISTTVTLGLFTIEITEPLKNNTGTVLGERVGVRASVLLAGTLEPVCVVADLETDEDGLLDPITHSALSAETPYHVAIRLADGAVGIAGPVTAS